MKAVGSSLQVWFNMQIASILSMVLFNLLSFSNASHGDKSLDVIYAVNCGGEQHTDTLGVPYLR